MVFAWDLSKATLVGPHSAYQISLSVRRSVKLRELDLETRVIIEDLCFSAREVSDPVSSARATYVTYALRKRLNFHQLRNLV